MFWFCVLLKFCLLKKVVHLPHSQGKAKQVITEVEETDGC